MYETANKVLEAARELGLGSDEFRQVAPSQWDRILKQVFNKFADTYETGVTWLWSHLKNQGASIQTENGLKYIGSLVKPKTQVWILFEDWDRTKKQGNYWVFEGTYGAAVGVLNNMHRIEYYIIDRKLNWMILENHHDFLVGIGEPAESFILNLRAARQGAPGHAPKAAGS